MIYDFIVLLNCITVKRGRRFFANEAEELKFEQQMFAKYSRSDDDYVEVIYK